MLRLILSAATALILYNISIILVVAQHARIARKERVKVRAEVISQEFMTEPNFSFDEIATELINERNIYAMPINTARRTVMDIQRINHRPITVQPA